MTSERLTQWQCAGMTEDLKILPVRLSDGFGNVMAYRMGQLPTGDIVNT